MGRRREKLLHVRRRTSRNAPCHVAGKVFLSITTFSKRARHSLESTDSRAAEQRVFHAADELTWWAWYAVAMHLTSALPWSHERALAQALSRWAGMLSQTLEDKKTKSRSIHGDVGEVARSSSARNVYFQGPISRTSKSLVLFANIINW